MRTIGVVTTSRADYGIYLPVLRAIREDPELRLWLYVTGMHLSPEFGRTVELIERDGFEIIDRVEMLLSSDSPEGIGKSMGLGTIGFAQAFARRRPDILLVLGDRFEMHAAVVAALPFKIPVAHIHGGESTEGLIDEAIRHSITKMSHLHFAATALYANRIVQMGEESWRVVVSGAPSLDHLHNFNSVSRQDLQQEIGIDFHKPFLLVTFHPVTLEFEDAPRQISELFKAIEETGMLVVFTYPNADTAGRQLIEQIRSFTEQHSWARAIVNLGTRRYFSLMSYAAAMVGNSSSGIIEAASFHLPVVNVGNRQRGRIHGPNVVDVPCERVAIRKAIGQVTAQQFHREIADVQNLYGDGTAAPRIVSKLKNVDLDNNLMLKKFQQI